MSIKLPGGVTVLNNGTSDDNDFLQIYNGYLNEINKQLAREDPDFRKYGMVERSHLATVYAATVLPEDSMASFFLNSQDMEDY